MGVITWESLGSTADNSDNVSMTIRELDDGVATGRQYTARLPKSKPFSEFRKQLKAQIVADRVKRAKEADSTVKIDLKKFEDEINL